ncbi:MAG: DUF4258 domain-containing protein [Phormidesmis sp.]
MRYEQIIFSGHAITRMFKRRIRQSDVVSVVKNGKIIAQYPNDEPFPSVLMLGFTEKKRPLHVVAAIDSEASTIFVITAYEPDSAIWRPDYQTRRKP